MPSSLRNADANPINPQNAPAASRPVALRDIRHDLTARALLLGNESEEGLRALQQAMFADLHPDGEIEVQLVEIMVASRWRIGRCWIMESCALHQRMEEQREQVESIRGWEEGLRDALAFASLIQERTLEHLNRVEARLVRDYDRSLQRLLQLKSKRHLTPPPDSTPLDTLRHFDTTTPPPPTEPGRPQPVDSALSTTEPGSTPFDTSTACAIQTAVAADAAPRSPGAL